ncbi:MAG: redoxin family protein [Myxococcaceae bacterium]
MATSRSWALLLGFFWMSISGPAWAREAPLQAGRSLQTLEGAPFELGAAVRDSRAVVLVFWTAGCPCVLRYQQRVEDLLTRYGPRGVTVLGVSSNAGEAPDQVKQALQARGVTLKVVRDPGGKLADAVGARSTPTVAILDQSGKVAFLGWIDNEREPGAADREPYVEQALDAILAGQRGFAKRSPVFGCRITRKLFDAPAASNCHQEALP